MSSFGRAQGNPEVRVFKCLRHARLGVSIVQHPSFDPVSHLHNDIFECIIHPYSASAFCTSLEKHNIASSYPLLANNLLHGFPLGSMPRLEKTHIFPNHPTCAQYAEFIKDYFVAEVSCGRMSGPFSQEDAERVLRGPFLSSPLIIDAQAQQPGMPDKLWLCRHLLKGSRLQESANSYISKEQFPTCFDTASCVAHLVSFFFFLVMVFPATFSSSLSSLRFVHELFLYIATWLLEGFAAGHPS